MTTSSICLALGNAARSAESCARMAQESKKLVAAQAQQKLATEMWDLAAWLAKVLAA